MFSIPSRNVGRVVGREVRLAALLVRSDVEFRNNEHPLLVGYVWTEPFRQIIDAYEKPLAPLTCNVEGVLELLQRPASNARGDDVVDVAISRHTGE